MEKPLKDPKRIVKNMSNLSNTPPDYVFQYSSPSKSLLSSCLLLLVSFLPPHPIMFSNFCHLPNLLSLHVCLFFMILSFSSFCRHCVKRGADPRKKQLTSKGGGGGGGRRRMEGGGGGGGERLRLTSRKEKRLEEA